MGMELTAERDDGALLVVDGPAAAVVTDTGIAYLPLASVMARPAEWKPRAGDVPQDVDAEKLGALRRRLDAQA